MTFIMPFIFVCLSLIMSAVFISGIVFVFFYVLFRLFAWNAQNEDQRRATAAEEARLKAAEKARLQVAADRFAANKTKAVGGFIDSLASCNTTSILLVGGGLFAIFCAILFTIASQRSI